MHRPLLEHAPHNTQRKTTRHNIHTHTHTHNTDIQRHANMHITHVCAYALDFDVHVHTTCEIIFCHTHKEGKEK